MPAVTRKEALLRGRHVCVVGAGTMGRGIAQVALQAGHAVTLVDPEERQLEAAVADIGSRLAKRHPEIAEAVGALLVTAADLTAAEAHPDTVVVEAVVEDLAVKHAVFGAALAHFGTSCVLATNTSSLSVTAIAAGTAAPERVVGMHFFNPVPAMRLVEVVRGLDTPEQLAADIGELAESWGKQVAHVRSAPGFIVNRVARPYYGEALRLLEERAASHSTIDQVLREAGGFRMGPFELMDLIGVEVNDTVTRTVWEAFNYDPRFAPSQLQAELVAAGRHGRKTGRGFYDHSRTGSPDPLPLVQPGPVPTSVTLHGHDEQLAALVRRAPGLGCQAGAGSPARPYLDLGEPGVMLVTRGRTAAAESELLGRPVVVLDRCLDPESVTTLAASATSTQPLDAAAGLLAGAGVGLVAIKDAPGLLVGRVVSMIVNEAWEAVHVGVADADDVDTAMTLGTNYPAGPFEWCRRWGTANVLALLDALLIEYGDPRYRASQAMRAAARAEARD